MKVDIELDDEQERKIVWDACREELTLGISSSITNGKPHFCAYLFNYRPSRLLNMTDFESAVKKQTVRKMIVDYIVGHIGFCFASSDDVGEKNELFDELRLLINDLEYCLKCSRSTLAKLK